MINSDSSGCITYEEMHPMTKKTKTVSKSIAPACVDTALMIGA